MDIYWNLRIIPWPVSTFPPFFPVIAMSEIKGVLPESDPHYLPPETFTHDAEGEKLSHKSLRKAAKKATKKAAKKKATKKAVKKKST